MKDEAIQDARAEKDPVYDLKDLLGKAAPAEERVKVSEYGRPHDEKSTWLKTKKATVARKKKEQRAKPTIKKKVKSLFRRGDEESTTLYLLGGIGAIAALTFLMK
jgi:hypothetical protein